MHCINEEAEKILDKEIPVLDHGFVRLVDYLGSDQRIVQAARVSYGDGTKSYREDKGLINYLLRNEHTSPFEQVNFTFHLKMPIFVARQWVRHRTGRMNEISGRYSVMKNECYIPNAEDICYQSKDNKQGRGNQLEPELAENVRTCIRKQQEHIFELYDSFIEMGVAKEIARINLPLSMYTEFYWQMDLHNLLHFLGLRMDHHAQFEIREYANAIFEIIKAVCPMTAEAFLEHKLLGGKISKKEKNLISRILQEINEEDIKAEGEFTARDFRILKEKLK